MNDISDLVTNRSDGLLRFATLEFNSDGTLRNNHFTSSESGDISPDQITRLNGQIWPKVQTYLWIQEPMISWLKLDNFAYNDSVHQLNDESSIYHITQNESPIGLLKKLPL